MATTEVPNGPAVAWEFISARSKEAQCSSQLYCGIDLKFTHVFSLLSWLQIGLHGTFFSFCFRLTPLRRKVCYKTGDSTPPTRLAEPERIHDNRTASSDDFVIGLVILLLFCAWERVMEGEGRILSEISQQLLQTSKQGHVFKWWTFLKPVIVVLKHRGPKWI